MNSYCLLFPRGGLLSCCFTQFRFKCDLSKLSAVLISCFEMTEQKIFNSFTSHANIKILNDHAQLDHVLLR